MKNEDLIILGVSGLAVFLLARYLVSKTGNPARSTTPPNNYNTTEIMRDNGWVYYSDGTVIGPDGKYYYQGQQVYDPRGMYK